MSLFGFGESSTPVARTKTKWYLVSTVLPTDTHGMYETMVFPLNKSGDVASNQELEVQHYESRHLAEEGHKKIVLKWKQYDEDRSELS
jgi:hypothetical protein|tara:strand:+ start:199 stop:462 length:264 start_codon:yes stop_codon:yes gene_type:complete